MTGLDRRPLERRAVLGGLGGATAWLAGCLDSFDGGDDGDGPEGDVEEQGERTFEPTVEHDGGGPLDFTGHNCAVCNMTPVDYPDWHSQVAHDDGEGAVTCTTGCLFAYVAATASESPITAGWTVDHETGDLIDATEAHFVLVTDEGAVDDPMKINPRAFADREDAAAFREEWDAEDLTEDDVIGLADVDREVASIYRGNRL